MPLAPAPYPSITKRPTYRGGGVDRRFSEATIFSDYLWGDIITEQRQAGIILLTLIAKYSYNKKVRIRAEKWPSGRRRLTRNQLSGLPFREFESHLLRHFYFHRNLTKAKILLTSGFFVFSVV